MKALKALLFAFTMISAYIAYLWYPWDCGTYAGGWAWYTPCDESFSLRLGMTGLYAIWMGVMFSAWRASIRK